MDFKTEYLGMGDREGIKVLLSPLLSLSAHMMCTLLLSFSLLSLLIPAWYPQVPGTPFCLSYPRKSFPTDYLLFHLQLWTKM